MTFTFQHPIPYVCGWSSTSSTSTSTTAIPSYAYEYGVQRKGGLSLPTDAQGKTDKVQVVLPTPAATDMDPYSLKSYVEIDGALGIFDGAGRNRYEDGQTIVDWNVLSPENAGSVSSTTSTTTTTTTTSTSTTTTTLTTTSTTTT